MRKGGGRTAIQEKGEKAEKKEERRRYSRKIKERRGDSS